MSGGKGMEGASGLTAPIAGAAGCHGDRHRSAVLDLADPGAIAETFTGIGRDCGIDLLQLEPGATDLDLRVAANAAKVHGFIVYGQASEIACTIDWLAFPSCECALVLLPKVPSTDLRAKDAQLACLAAEDWDDSVAPRLN